MNIIARRVYRSLGKTIFLGILLSIIISVPLYFIHIAWTIVGFIICCVILGVKVSSISKFNNNPTHPIFIKDDKIYCNDGKESISFPVKNLYYAIGKSKKYFHIFASFISWGTYNYGKIKVYFRYHGQDVKFVIKYVLEPETAAVILNDYKEKSKKLN